MVSLSKKEAPPTHKQSWLEIPSPNINDDSKICYALCHRIYSLPQGTPAFKNTPNMQRHTLHHPLLLHLPSLTRSTSTDQPDKAYTQGTRPHPAAPAVPAADQTYSNASAD